MSTILFLLIPVFLLIVAAEWWISYKRADKKYSLENTSMNIAIGAVDRLGSLFTMTILYVVLNYVYLHFALFHFSNSWYQWIAAYIAVDFISYWFHRYSHEINILWAGHVTHHSSSHFNLSNGFRTSVFQGFNRIPFWIVLPVVGFSPIVLLVIFNISGIYDFFMHTAYFSGNRWVEKIFITPSLHKVHHGKNDLYLDKNYGSTFSVWDRMFGTFQPETETVEFGIKGNYKDVKPLYAITYYYSLLFTAIKKARLNLFHVLFANPSRSKFISAADSSITGTSASSSYMYTFALFNLVSGIIIDFAALMEQNTLRISEFFGLYALGLVAIISAAKVLNGSCQKDFIFYQLVYSVTGCLTVLGFYLSTRSDSSFYTLWYFVLLVMLTANAWYIQKLNASDAYTAF